MIAPDFTPQTKEYMNRIVIYEGTKKDHEWK